MKPINSLEDYREAMRAAYERPRWIAPALAAVLFFFAAWVIASDIHTLGDAYRHVQAALELVAR